MESKQDHFSKLFFFVNHCYDYVCLGRRFVGTGLELTDEHLKKNNKTPKEQGHGDWCIKDNAKGN